jgi:DNA-binding GntR family transcriptional regulator
MEDSATEIDVSAEGAEAPARPKSERSAADTAYEGIIDLILTRGLRPGERTSVYLLAERLGLGRMPVKEAVARLEIEGVLSIKGRSGTTVASVDPRDIAQMFALRRVLEAFAADSAVVAATAEDLEKVCALAAEMREASISAPDAAGAAARFVRANAAFHAAIIDAAHNPFLRRAYNQLQLHFQIVSYLSNRGPDRQAALDRQAEHEEITSALAARDGERLKEVLHRHGLATERSLTNALG